MDRDMKEEVKKALIQYYTADHVEGVLFIDGDGDVFIHPLDRMNIVPQQNVITNYCILKEQEAPEQILYSKGISREEIEHHVDVVIDYLHWEMTIDET